MYLRILTPAAEKLIAFRHRWAIPTCAIETRSFAYVNTIADIRSWTRAENNGYFLERN